MAPSGQGNAGAGNGDRRQSTSVEGVDVKGSSGSNRPTEQPENYDPDLTEFPRASSHGGKPRSRETPISIPSRTSIDPYTESLQLIDDALEQTTGFATWSKAGVYRDLLAGRRALVVGEDGSVYEDFYHTLCESLRLSDWRELIRPAMAAVLDFPRKAGWGIAPEWNTLLEIEQAERTAQSQYSHDEDGEETERERDVE